MLLLLTGSGCAALIYEVVWFQMLELVIGSSAISMAVLLGTFMGGMGLGNLLLPRCVGSQTHPIRVYAMLELGIGLSALVIWFALPSVGRFYLQMGGPGRVDFLGRAILCVALFLPPTMMMGATFPIIARWTRTTPKGVSWLGACYAVNLVGAVTGCLLAGFYLLRFYNAGVANVFAMGLNVMTALLALALVRCTPRPEMRDEPVVRAAEPHPSSPGRRLTYAAIALSGFCALTAQVVWTRLLSLLLGGTVYTFSIILAVFLAGLGLGGLLGGLLVRNAARPGNIFAWCQLFQVMAVAWADDLMTRTLPFWPGLNTERLGITSQSWADLLRCGCAMLPATIAWGASFPLAIAMGAAGPSDPGRSVGRVYAANTGGAVLGAVLASLVLLPSLGTSRVEVLLIGGSVTAALLVVRPADKAGWARLMAVLGLAIWLGARPSEIPWQLVAYGRHAAEGNQEARVLYLGEGAQATVAVTENASGARYFHVSGKTEASSQYYDMRLQRMLGHLPALLHPRPRSILVVGLGAGVTAGSFVLHPSVERIVICEVEPLVVRHVAGLFATENNQVLEDPRVEIVIDDARHFLAKTKDKFDIITTDPIHPWVNGAAKLYSSEYLTLCRDHLNPGGLVTQWVPFYQSSREAVQSELATFFRVFPGGLVWGNATDGKGYDSVLIGGKDAIRVDLDSLEARLARRDHTAIRRSLADVQLFPVERLLANYAGCGADLRDWLLGAEINEDRSLRLQYLAGVSLNSHTGAGAYGEIVSHRRFPAELFRGDESLVARLRAEMDPLAAADHAQPRRP